MTPETRYTVNDGVNLAYQVVGDGPIDVIFVHGWVSNVEYGWEVPPLARFLRRLASFSRLILFDRRGTGLSDRVPVSGLPTLEQRMEDVRAVLDAVGSERTAIFGASEGGGLSLLFAATYPERSHSLVTFGTFAKRIWSEDYPWAPTREGREFEARQIRDQWGSALDVSEYAPSADPLFAERLSAFFRMSASPGAAEALLWMNTDIDVRHVLPVIHVPTLVLHRSDDKVASVEEGRWIAGQIPGARFVELSGADHLPYAGDQDAVLDEVEEFLTGARRGPEPERVLTTVLFTDIVGSTERAAELGDRRWRDLLAQHHQLIRGELEHWRGREVVTTGDGFLATFDGPARAVRCAKAICRAVRSLGIEVRAGVHTGEVELLGDDVGGISVHIGARVSALAGPGEVLVSGTVIDLVSGSALEFEERGLHELKGVPGQWRVYAVVGA